MSSSSSSSPIKQGLNPLQFVLNLMPNWGRVVTLAAAGILTVLLATLFAGSLNTLEERLGAMGWTLNADSTPEESIILVTIDEKSLAEVGPWPWSRQDMAALVKAVDVAGAQIQLHDIYYPEAKPGDAEFIAELQAARGAVLAQVPTIQSDQDVRVGSMSHPLAGVSCSAANTAQSYIANHSGFAAIPKGHITSLVASDGAIRQIPAVVCVDGASYPALAISGFLQAINSDSSDWGGTISAGTSMLGPAQVLRLDDYPGFTIPLDDQGNLRISYKTSPDSYIAVSASDVMAGNIEPGLLDNAWVLVSGTALSMGDVVPTPYSGAAYGVELQARILGSLLDAQVPYTPKSSSGLLFFISLTFAAVLLKLAAASGRVSAYGLPIAALLLPIAAWAFHSQLLNSSEIWLGWVSPALYSMLAASLLLLLEQSRVRVERSRVFGNLNSYLPSDIAKEIAYSLPSSSINAKRCDVTLLSADLRNFAAFGEARPPEESAAVLHFFFVRATEIVEKHGGRVHEFKGDSLLAVWDGHDREAAQSALNSALEMQKTIDEKMLTPQAANGLEPLALGVGIEQGPALIGSIGPAHRRSHTLLGDTVTITLRIQELTAELAQPVLLGECIARQLDDSRLESQGSFLLSGLRIPHTLFAPAVTEEQLRELRQELKKAKPDLKVVSINSK